MRSGFVTLVGRPNVGKSTLVNAMCGRKVSIVSDKPQTRAPGCAACSTTPEAQLVFVDTPGLHKPVTALGERVNATALDSVDDVDAVCLVHRRHQAVRHAATSGWPGTSTCRRRSSIVNKIDRVDQDSGDRPARRRRRRSAPSDYFPVSAKTGEGVPALVAHLVALMPEGPAVLPRRHRQRQPEETWVAELVREQLLAVTHDELPYSIATRVTEWEWPRIRSRSSSSATARRAWSSARAVRCSRRSARAARAQLPEGAYLELFVKVDKDWQRRPDRVERLGY